MFLPVLLVRDYGVWGFVAFAVPNVVGAGAMGWVLNAAAARRIIEKHWGAAVAFGCITALFQVFFLFWMSNAIERAYPEPGKTEPQGAWWGLLLIFAGIGVVSWIARRRHGDRWLASGLWCVSCAIGAWLQASGKLDFLGAFSRVASSGHSKGALFLAPICIFGFALCPYLDLTFLRAASEQSRSDARASFTLGFGALFFAMILLTLGYATAYVPITSGAEKLGVLPQIINLVGLHIVLQLIYTSCLHVARVVRVLGTRGPLPRIVLFVCVVSLFPLVWESTYHWLPSHAGLIPEEIIYRCFMSFYGLVFPAYVWLCMIPTADGHSGIAGPQGKKKLAVLGFACLLAAPCYWMGFIERVEWWLAIGLGIVLVARMFVRSAGGSAEMEEGIKG